MGKLRGKSVMRRGGTLVARTAESLADLSLAKQAGQYLGAEVDLLHRLGVSRPTLRQAAKIVENECLISVRRGIRGGFYAERPSPQDSIRALTRYLRLNGATLAQVFAVTRLVAEEAVVQATIHGNAVQRQELTLLRDAISTNTAREDVLRSEAALGQLLADMSGNPTVRLYMEIGYTFGMEEPAHQFYVTPEDRSAARAAQRDLCDAVLSGDGDLARLKMQRRSAMIAAWLETVAQAPQSE